MTQEDYDRNIAAATLATIVRERDGALDERDRLRSDLTEACRDRNLSDAALKETCAELAQVRRQNADLHADVARERDKAKVQRDAFKRSQSRAELDLLEEHHRLKTVAKERDKWKAISTASAPSSQFSRELDPCWCCNGTRKAFNATDMEWSICLACRPEPAKAPPASPDAPRRFLHRKRGSTYTLIGLAELQAIIPVPEGEILTVYRCESDGRIWARPASEFDDGRFEEII